MVSATIEAMKFLRSGYALIRQIPAEPLVGALMAIVLCVWLALR